VTSSMTAIVLFARLLVCVALPRLLAEQAQTSGADREDCPDKSDGLRTGGQQSLLQVAQATHHPGTGRHIFPTEEPGTATVKDAVNGSQAPFSSYFSTAALGAPMEGGELRPPLFEEVDLGPEGQGVALILAVMFFSILCCLLVLAMLDTVDNLEKTDEPTMQLQGPTTSLAQASTERAKAGVPPARLRPWPHQAGSGVPLLPPVPEAIEDAIQIDANQSSEGQTGMHLPALDEVQDVAHAEQGTSAIHDPEQASESAPDLVQAADGPSSERAEVADAVHLPPLDSALPPVPFLAEGSREPSDAMAPDEFSAALQAALGDASGTRRPPRLFMNTDAWQDTDDDLPFPFSPMSGRPTLCPRLVVPPTEECVLAIPVPQEGFASVYVLILGLDGKPVLRAEVYRGIEAKYSSPVLEGRWPPESAHWHEQRQQQRPSFVLTSLPTEQPRLLELHSTKSEIEDSSDPTLFALGYLVRGAGDNLEMDLVDGTGRFFGRLARDAVRPSRFALVGGDLAEVNVFIDGVFDDHALLLTDGHQEELGDVEVADPQGWLNHVAQDVGAARFVRMRINGTYGGVDAGLMLAVFFGSYEIRYADRLEAAPAA